MPVKMRLCFIDLDDWFKICFIPISAIIFVCLKIKKKKKQNFSDL